MGRGIIVFAALLAVGTGCRVAEVPEGATWRVTAPPVVNRGEDLVFTVEVDGAAGPVPYLYSVDWSFLKGTRHHGESGRPERIRAKGSAGRGQLRIYRRGADRAVRQVAAREFEIR